MKNRVLRYYSILFLTLFLCVNNISSQPSAELDSMISKAGELYSSDKLDSSAYYYKIVAESDLANYRLAGLSGLIKLAVFKNDFSAADSLIVLGDPIAENLPYDKDVSRYNIMKAEYLKKNSRLLDALALHKENARRSKLLDDKVQYADILLYTALVYEKLSQYDSCLVYADKAAILFETHIDTTEVRYGSICNSLGVCYYRANQFEKAKNYYKKSMRIAEEKLGSVSSDLANTLINLSAIYSTEQDYDKAIVYTKRSLAINRVLNDLDGMSTNYYSLGVYFYYKGDYGRAKDYLEACIDIREDLYNAYHFRLFWPYQVLGIAIQESGDFESTVYYNNKALEIVKRNYGDASLDEGMLYENMANCYLSMGQIDSSVFYIKKSAAILSKQLTKDDYALAIHYFTMASIYLEAGKLELAHKYIQKSNEIMVHLASDETSDFAQNLALYATIETERGQQSNAEDLFRKSLDLIQTDSLYNLNANTFWVIGKYISYQFDRYKETGDRNYLDRMNAFAEKYKKLSNDFRKQFMDSYTKSILIQNNAQVFKKSVGIYFDLYKSLNDKSYLEAAFENSENNRTTLIRDMLDNNISKFSGVEDSVIQIEKALRSTVSDLNQAYLEDPESEEIKSRLFEAKENLNKHLDELKVNYPEYFKARFDNTITSLQQAQSSLNSNQILIEYMQDDTAYYAIVISPTNVDMKYIGSSNIIDSEVLRWRDIIISQSTEDLLKLANELYEILLQPLISKTRAENLIIVPSGVLYYLNFEALSSSEEEHVYLIRDYNINYALSVNLLFNESIRKSTPDKGVAIAIAPGFEDAIKGQYQEALDSLELVDEDYLHTVRQPWSVKLAEKLKTEYRNKIYTGLNATESSIKTDIHKGNIIYFGTHAISNSEDPMRSKLVLAKEVGPQTEDGYLHAYEIYGLSLNADLAVLTACESGVGQLKEGEGMISLAYSLNFAGCPSTVMSLWKIDEKTNTWITDAFFENISDGMTKSAALRKAKLDFLDKADPLLQHPYFWSGMILMGQDGMVQLDNESNFKWYLLFGLLALLVITWRILRRKKETH